MEAILAVKQDFHLNYTILILHVSNIYIVQIGKCLTKW